jgi:hypothetical protein
MMTLRERAALRRVIQLLRALITENRGILTGSEEQTRGRLADLHQAEADLESEEAAGYGT